MTSLKDVRVLFADDELYSMRPTIDALEVRGAVVDVCKDGTEVLEYLRQHVHTMPQLVILDLMMAEGAEIRTPDEGRSTGVEVYRRLRREIDARLPIVVSTVVTDDSMLGSFQNDRKVTIVRKPYQFDELLRAIDRVC